MQSFDSAFELGVFVCSSPHDQRGDSVVAFVIGLLGFDRVQSGPHSPRTTVIEPAGDECVWRASEVNVIVRDVFTRKNPRNGIDLGTHRSRATRSRLLRRGRRRAPQLIRHKM